MDSMLKQVTRKEHIVCTSIDIFRELKKFYIILSKEINKEITNNDNI